jgi:hypothetical protein
VIVAVASAGAAQAEPFDARDWYRRAMAAAETLIGKPVDREVIVPPRDIDPKMALVPSPQGTMRIIVPPKEAGGRP